MRYIPYIITASLLGISYVGVYADTEIIPSPDPTCNQYFNAGYMYEGDFGKVLSDDVYNLGTNELDIYADEQTTPPFIDVGGSTVVSYKTPEFQFVSDFLSNCNGTWCIGGSTGRQFTFLNQNQRFKWLQTLPNKHLQVVSVDKSRVNNTNRAQIRDAFFKIKYTIKGHFWSNISNSFVGDFNHVECQQIGVHFCGDGVIESGKEACDPADPAHTGWGTAGCNTSCQPVAAVVPACNSIVASPTFGTTPVTTTLTCSGSNLPTNSTYAIECGNGTNATMTGNSGTCTYTNSSLVNSVTFAPKCTINGTLTSTACQTNVGVNPAPTPGNCSTILTGLQTSPVLAGQCNVGTPINFVANGTNPVNYTWSCTGVNGGVTSPVCSASFTSVPMYSACIPNNPTADCVTNTYVTQAACLLANPGASGRTCYLNNTVACNASRATQCPVVTPSCVAGSTTGSRTAAVTSGDANLCAAGTTLTVGSFTGILATNGTTNYSWSCNGLSGGNCSASYSPGGGGSCVTGNPAIYNGTAVSSPITQSTPQLCSGSETVGNFTAIVSGTTTKYSWSCNSIAGINCSAFYSTVGTTGSSCAIGNISGIQTSPLNVNTPGLCLSGVPVTNFGFTVSGDTTTYNWSCSGISGCSASYKLSTGGSITIPGSSSYCGNGNVERPNGLGTYENCDTTALWCDSSCNIASTNPGSIPPGNLTITTTPGNMLMNIYPDFKLILGNGVPVFGSSDTISFETTNPIYLDNKTATVTNKSVLISGTTITNQITGGVGGLLRMNGVDHKTYDGAGNLLTWTITYDQQNYPSSIALFQGYELQNIKGDANTIITGGYKDTNMTLPMSIGTGLYATLQYLEAPFNIRVSKPIISNTAGGSAFIGSILGYSVNNVVDSFMNNLKSGNFTTSTINVASSYALSSATKSASNDAVLSDRISADGTSEVLNIGKGSTGQASVTTPTTTSIASELHINSLSTKFGDDANIRVFKDGDVSIDADLQITGVKTIIIEHGDLIIKKNMTYRYSTGSIAWIVKNGNIVITDSVTKIAGVYVTLAGAIMSNNVSTPNRLTVDGSLYGNTSNLVENRTYIRGQIGYSSLNVGVVVNYSNRAIMFPPPFLSRFLDQYSLQRVVK